MAIELTDEIRQAVLDELCADQGHAIDIGNLFGVDPNNINPRQQPQPMGPEGKLPHVICTRCKRVLGVLIALEAPNYTQAEKMVGGMLRDHTQLDKRRGPKRRDHRAPREYLAPPESATPDGPVSAPSDRGQASG